MTIQMINGRDKHLNPINSYTVVKSPFPFQKLQTEQGDILNLEK